MNDKTITINITTTNKKDIQFILSNLEFGNSIFEYGRDIITSPEKYWINATFELKKECMDVLEKKYKSEISKISIERLFSLLCGCKKLICNYSIDEIVYTLIKGFNSSKISDLLYTLLHKLDLFNDTDFMKYYTKKEEKRTKFKVKEIYKEKGSITYYKVKEVLEIYNLQVVLFRVITDHTERAFMFEYWTDGTYKFYIWTGFNYKEIDVYNCKNLDKVTAYLLEGLEYYLSGLNYSDEGKTLKSKINGVKNAIIIDDVDFKEV